MTIEELKTVTLEGVHNVAKFAYENLKKENETYGELKERAFKLCVELGKESENDRISREMAERLSNMINEEADNIKLQ